MGAEVQDQLKDILDIAMTSSAFAAVRADGSCIMWGNAPTGGDCRPKIQETVLKNKKYSLYIPFSNIYCICRIL